jgi:hypothetical protein
MHRVLLPFLWVAGVLNIAAPILPADDPAGVVYLDQGWDDEVRQTYYYSPQGSMILPYDWFLALEQPFANRLFREDEHLEGFRYLPNAAGKHNPDGLPVGFVLSKREGRNWLGMTSSPTTERPSGWMVGPACRT